MPAYFKFISPITFIQKPETEPCSPFKLKWLSHVSCDSSDVPRIPKIDEMRLKRKAELVGALHRLVSMRRGRT